jgi:outer membrane lipoprotein SlyB
MLQTTPQTRNLIIAVLCVVLCLFSFGCVSTQVVATGTVVNQLQLKKVDFVPQHNTDVGALSGAGVGAISGAMIGIGITLATFGLAAPSIPVLTAAGGAVGGTAGAATGYAGDIIEQGHGLYDYVIEIDNSHQKMIIRQYAMTNIPNNTKVKVIKEKGILKIEKLK